MLKRTLVILCLLAALASIPVGMAVDDGQDDVEPVCPIPVVKYVTASPRACLTGPCCRCANVRCCARGAAENFARANGSLTVPVGTKVIFCLSDQIEGVWYPGSCGRLGTSLVLQWCRTCISADDCDCEQCTPVREQATVENGTGATAVASAVKLRTRAVVEAEPVPVEPKPCPWVTIGRDGARDARKGPSIGTARVGVPVRFWKPGFYYMRTIVHTYARPWCRTAAELTPDDAAAERCCPCGAADKDIVYIRVRVVDIPVADAEALEGVVAEPDAVHARPIPNDMDATEQWGEDGDVPLE